MDIRLIRKQLQIEFTNLNTSDYDSAEIAATDFFDFIYDNATTREIIEKLPTNSVNVEEWVKNFYNTELTMPRDKKERISFLLAVLDAHKSDLPSISHYFHVGSNKIIDHIRKYIDTMIKPIYQYLDNELHIKEIEATPVSTTSITANNSIIISGNNYGSVTQANSYTFELLGNLSEVLRNSVELTNDQKVEAINNIDTIKNQIVSPKPNMQIIKLAWKTVSALATVSGASEFVEKIAELLSSFQA